MATFLVVQINLIKLLPQTRLFPFGLGDIKKDIMFENVPKIFP